MHAICDLPSSELVALCAQTIARPVPATPPIDADWQIALDDRIALCPDMLQVLRRSVLERFGGGEVLISAARLEDAHPLLERGQLWVPEVEEIDYLEGKPCHCHDNVADFWKDQPDRYVLATGFGLSPDGLWRPHSWLMEPQNEGPARIVETTVGRLAYFGYVMNLAESIGFVFGDLPPHLRERAAQLLRQQSSSAQISP